MIKKKTVRQKKTCLPAGRDKPAGSIIHYFSNVKVAVVRVLVPLSEGDAIRIVGGEDTDFKQKIRSIESDHKRLKKAKKGAEVGIRVNKKVREGYRVYKI